LWTRCGPITARRPATLGDLSRRFSYRSGEDRRRCIVIRKLACALLNSYFSRSFRRKPPQCVACGSNLLRCRARIKFPRARHGAWRSLVAHLLWEQRVGGSNPSAPTTCTIAMSISGMRSAYKSRYLSVAEVAFCRTQLPSLAPMAMFSRSPYNPRALPTSVCTDPSTGLKRHTFGAISTCFKSARSSTG
jgi:hypothetical protein